MISFFLYLPVFYENTCILLENIISYREEERKKKSISFCKLYFDSERMVPMYYHSTRSSCPSVGAAEAVLQGLAPDGGLFISALPPFDWEALMELDTLSMAERILTHLLPDVEHMDRLVQQAYRGRFETDHLTPLVPVGDRFVLELFRGPTSAFKDVALSMLPQLMTRSGEQLGVQEEVLILTATSGDTGKAAMTGFCNVPGIKIIVFYPEEGVSPVQKAQMVTQEGANVCVCAVRGNFDDAQTGVKEIFRKGLPRDQGVRLSSANSINIGRLAPQVVYYFRAYADLLAAGRIRKGDKVDFVVPTGNFGNILAGYYAKRLGLPVGTLVCASNRNDVLTDFLETGTYDRRRPFHKTLSPSMDILVSSNLERLLYLLCEDPKEVASYMEQLKTEGCYTVSPRIMAKLRETFARGSCSDEDTKRTIAAVWQDHGYLMDTHTAVAWKVSQDRTGERPTVILSTASPYKFPAAVLSALGETPGEDEFAVMDRLCALTGVPVPKNLQGLEHRPVLHSSVIDREAMADFVMRKVQSWNE